jgi:hypothetical protein
MPIYIFKNLAAAADDDNNNNIWYFSLTLQFLGFYGNRTMKFDRKDIIIPI